MQISALFTYKCDGADNNTRNGERTPGEATLTDIHPLRHCNTMYQVSFAKIRRSRDASGTTWANLHPVVPLYIETLRKDIPNTIVT